MNRLLLLVLPLTLAACASDTPRAIREAPPENIRPDQALKDAERLRGAEVRWGGTIAAVENRKEETWLEIVEHPLTGGGRPRDTDRSGGRFLARVSGFLDPAIYARDRLITVAGQLEDPQSRRIGEYPYRYPVVKAGAAKLWPREAETAPTYYSPYWVDPWYPWGYPYPYRRRR